MIQAKMDGRIAFDQEMELNRLLSKSGYEQDDFERLIALQKHLDNLKPKDEQIDVTARVMQAILNNEQFRKKAVPLENTTAWNFGFSAVRLAAALLAGILLGSAVTWMLMDAGTKPDKDLLRGSMMANESQVISFMQQHTVLKMKPFMLDELYYLNFFIESPEDVLIELSFNPLEFTPRKSDFIDVPDARAINTANGYISFTTKGRATVLLILEKAGDSRAQITVRAERNKVPLFNKQLFFN